MLLFFLVVGLSRSGMREFLFSSVKLPNCLLFEPFVALSDSEVFSGVLRPNILEIHPEVDLLDLLLSEELCLLISFCLASVCVFPDNLLMLAAFFDDSRTRALPEPTAIPIIEGFPALLDVLDVDSSGPDFLEDDTLPVE